MMPATPAGMLAMAMGMKKGLTRLGPSHAHDGDLLDERVGAAKARSAMRMPVCLGQLTFEPLGQAGVVEGLARGHQGHLRGAVGAPDLLAVEHRRGVEVA